MTNYVVESYLKNVYEVSVVKFFRVIEDWNVRIEVFEFCSFWVTTIKAELSRGANAWKIQLYCEILIHFKAIENSIYLFSVGVRPSALSF